MLAAVKFCETLDIFQDENARALLLDVAEQTFENTTIWVVFAQLGSCNAERLAGKPRDI